jgi:hypothetical protein
VRPPGPRGLLGAKPIIKLRRMSSGCRPPAVQLEVQLNERLPAPNRFSTLRSSTTS